MRSLPDIDIPDVDPLLGRELDGRWLVLEPIARGGMGTVYRGVHLELGRTVAIKVLAPTYADSEEAVLRFLREARTTAEIDHPSVVPILDLGRLDGAPYLVMELLEGEDLADVIAREAPMPPARVAELLGPVARAIDAVHAAGLLHRDIKPANVFLARRPDGKVTPTLIDFGLAARIDSQGDEPDRRLTREGVVVGTPHYVSPEAAEGAVIDARSDIYSLALIVFEMLTGLLPVDEEQPVSLLVERVRKPAPTLSARSGRSYPSELERLVARALSRNPDKRPSTAAALIDGLNPPEPAEVAPVEPEPPSAPSDARPRRRPMLWIGAALVLLGAILVVGWSAWPEDEVVARPLTQTAERVPEVEPPAIEAEPIVAPRAAPTPPVERPRRAVRRLPPPRAPQGDPDRAAGLAREGSAALLRGQFARARTLFRQATQSDGAHAAAWRGLGLASEQMGLAPEAARAYRRYLALSPRANDAARVRARLRNLSR